MPSASASMTTCSRSSPIRWAARRTTLFPHGRGLCDVRQWRRAGRTDARSTASRTATGAPSTATTSGSVPIASLPQLDPGMGPRIVSNRERVIDPVTAYQVTSMMQGVVQRGIGGRNCRRRADPRGRWRAKTGTTNGRPRRVVRGLFIDHRGRMLHRLRPASQPRQPRLGRRHVRACLRRVHARGGSGVRRRTLRGAARRGCSTRSTAIRASGLPSGSAGRACRLRAVPRGRGRPSRGCCR